MSSFALGALVIPVDHGEGASPRWSIRFAVFDEVAKGDIHPAGVIAFNVSGDGAVEKGEANVMLAHRPEDFRAEAIGGFLKVSEDLPADAGIAKSVADYLAGLSIEAAGCPAPDLAFVRAHARRVRTHVSDELRASIEKARTEEQKKWTAEQWGAHVEQMEKDLDKISRRKEVLTAALAIHPMAFAISLLHCKNVELRPVEPVEALSRAHMKRRGRPLVRYHVLHIEPMKAVLKTEGHVGEVGLAKAMHIARGHFKDFRNGKGLFGRYKGVYWWPQHLRGNAEHGTVLKDYRVSTPPEDVG